MVSHPETGSDSPIGSDRDWGRDTIPLPGSKQTIMCILYSINISYSRIIILFGNHMRYYYDYFNMNLFSYL